MRRERPNLRADAAPVVSKKFETCGFGFRYQFAVYLPLPGDRRAVIFCDALSVFSPTAPAAADSRDYGGQTIMDRSVEDAAKEVLSIWAEHELFFWYDATEDHPEAKQCYSPRCLRHYQTTANKNLMRKIEGGIACNSCGRRLVFQDYWLDGKRAFKNKRVRDIGESLNDAEGQEAMQRVAYRFAALGGKVSDLSKCWDGIGSWLD